MFCTVSVPSVTSNKSNIDVFCTVSVPSVTSNKSNIDVFCTVSVPSVIDLTRVILTRCVLYCKCTECYI